MSLLALTEAHAAPSYIQTYLGKHFDRVVIMQTVAQSNHQFAAVAIDANDQPRLAVLFNWNNGCWRYDIHQPKTVNLKPLDNDGE
jgi:hypothetical protein